MSPEEHPERCGWQTGIERAGRSPSTCDRPARYRLIRSRASAQVAEFVCGIHGRSVVAWNYGKLEPIADE